MHPDLQKHDANVDISKTKSSVYKGLLMALLSGVLYSLSAVIVKLMKNLHPGQLAVYRFLAIMAFSFPEAVKCQENLLGPKDSRFLLLIRAILLSTSLFLNYIAFRYLPLGEASVIIFSVPIFVTVAARIFLKEPCGKLQFLTVLITVVGIIFTTKIPEKLSGKPIVYTKESIYGLLSAVVSLILITIRMIVTRKVKHVHRSIMMFTYGWIPIVETIILTAIFGNFQLYNCGRQSLYIIILCFTSYGGYSFMVMAFQCEMAGPVSTMRAASDIVLSFLWQIFMFQDIPDICSSLGAVLVGTSVFFVGLQKWVSNLREESPCRKKLSWMLK